MTDGLFDERIAARYDETSAAMYDDAVLRPTVDTLYALADRGSALELAVGTGRVALPLRARGIDVHGIELSGAMVERLRAKPGGREMRVATGDMTTVRLDRTFRLVYLVYNTISNLVTQDAQVECFRNAAAHLEPSGRFVVEDLVPALQRLPRGQRFSAFEVTPGHVGIDEYDVVDQSLTSHHYWIDGDRVERFDSVHRYAWPAELDLMARIAGLVPEARWGGWAREPFTAESASHVSVWRKPP